MGKFLNLPIGWIYIKYVIVLHEYTRVKAKVIFNNYYNKEYGSEEIQTPDLRLMRAAL